MFTNMTYVYEVYKERSFSKAALNLYISQPALSAAVKKIETKIGMPIFERSTNPIQLTECGEKYIKTIEAIMDLENNFSAEVENLGDLHTGRLVVGGSNLFASFLLPPIIAKFKSTHPNVEISLVEHHTASLEKRLFEGTVDVIIDNLEFSRETYEKISYSEEFLLLAVPAPFLTNMNINSGLSAQDIKNGLHKSSQGVDVSIFKDLPFIFLRSYNDTRERAQKICSEYGFTPNVALKLNQQITSYHITDFGMGISFISDTLIQKIAPSDNITYFNIDSPLAKRSVHFHYKKNKYCTNAMRAFFEIAQNTY